MTCRMICVDGINPEPWAVGTASASRRGGQIKGSLSPNAKLQTYQNALREELAHSYLENAISGPMTLAFFFWRQIEIGHSGSTGREVRGHVADVTNLQKATEDACQGILFGNDRETVDVYSKIVQQDESAQPGIVIMFGTFNIDSLILLDAARGALMNYRGSINFSPDLDPNPWSGR